MYIYQSISAYIRCDIVHTWREPSVGGGAYEYMGTETGYEVSYGIAITITDKGIIFHEW